MIRRTVSRPIPSPSTWFSPSTRTNGLKTSPRRSAGIPMPASLTQIRKVPASFVLPIVIRGGSAPQYFTGQIGLGTLTQTADAFGQVQGSLSWFVDTYTQLAAWQATVNRLTTFGEAMVRAKRAAGQSGFDIRTAPERLELRNVEVQLPDGTTLLQGVDITLREGESVVVRGASGETNLDQLSLGSLSPVSSRMDSRSIVRTASTLTASVFSSMQVAE